MSQRAARSFGEAVELRGRAYVAARQRFLDLEAAEREPTLRDASRDADDTRAVLARIWTAWTDRAEGMRRTDQLLHPAAEPPPGYLKMVYVFADRLAAFDELRIPAQLRVREIVSWESTAALDTGSYENAHALVTHWKEPSFVEPLAEVMNDPGRAMPDRLLAMRTLRTAYADRRATQFAEGLLFDAQRSVDTRKSALSELASTEDPSVFPRLRALITDDAAPTPLRTAAANTLAVGLGDEGATPFLVDALRTSRDVKLTIALVMALGEIGNDAALNTLRRMASRPASSDVQSHLREAIEDIERRQRP